MTDKMIIPVVGGNKQMKTCLRSALELPTDAQFSVIQKTKYEDSNDLLTIMNPVDNRKYPWVMQSELNP